MWLICFSSNELQNKSQWTKNSSSSKWIVLSSSIIPWHVIVELMSSCSSFYIRKFYFLISIHIIMSFFKIEIKLILLAISFIIRALEMNTFKNNILNFICIHKTCCLSHLIQISPIPFVRLDCIVSTEKWSWILKLNKLWNKTIKCLRGTIFNIFTICYIFPTSWDESQRNKESLLFRSIFIFLSYKWNNIFISSFSVLS
jgi:hypothetical protein